MRLGVIADAHLGPPGRAVPSYHSGYENADTIKGYELALRRCVEGGADGVALLGDLSNAGDNGSLETGLSLAARTGLPVWVVSGNHDCGERKDALAEAVQRVGAKNVRLATPEGEALKGVRVAGVSVASEGWGYANYADGRPDVQEWGDDAIVWLTHYPVISYADEAEKRGLVYGDNLEDLEELAAPLLGRRAPTVATTGHVHLLYSCISGSVLQVACPGLVEPPFEVTFLDLEPENEGFFVRRKTEPLVSRHPMRVPHLSPLEQEWRFERGSWRFVEP
ncbi:MAG TPA: metallophosphoesterase [Rubrobacteraceae bacterium]|nr:metallophosphoesterase [Rubrobacteraceae bacterium]